MKQNQLILTWPQDLQNESWVPITDILPIIAPPQLQGCSGRKYMLAATECDNVLELFAARQNS